MNKYLYIFGSRTPEDNRKPNSRVEQHSQAIFIEASSEQDALAWGEEISEEFTRQVFHNRTMSWKEMHLPRCIADQSFLECGLDEVRKIPVVSCGRYPSFGGLG